MNNKKIDDKKQKQDKKKIHYANYENKIIYPNNPPNNPPTSSMMSPS